MKFLLAVIMFLSWVGVAEANTADQPNYSYQQFASQSVWSVWNGLGQCGLRRYNAYDPRLPRPQIPATDAVLNSQGRILAYSLDASWQNPASYEFKNPNGSMNHFVSYTPWGIQFSTPYGGAVARANTVTSVNGTYVQYFCGYYQVNYPQFAACVQTNWVNFITQQLCRFPKD